MVVEAGWLEEEETVEPLLCLGAKSSREDKATLSLLLLELGPRPALADNTMQINAADNMGRSNLFLCPRACTFDLRWRGSCKYITPWWTPIC